MPERINAPPVSFSWLVFLNVHKFSRAKKSWKKTHVETLPANNHIDQDV